MRNSNNLQKPTVAELWIGVFALRLDLDGQTQRELNGASLQERLCDAHEPRALLQASPCAGAPQGMVNGLVFAGGVGLHATRKSGGRTSA